MFGRGGLASNHIWISIAKLLKADMKNSYALSFLHPGNQNRFWDEACSIYAQALSKFKKHFGNDSYWVGITLIHWGAVMRDGASKDIVCRAKDRLHKGVNILNRIYHFRRESQREVLIGQLNLVKANCYQRKYTIAERKALKCEEIILDTYGPVHPLVKHAYNQLKFLYFPSFHNVHIGSMTRVMEYADKQNVWRFLRENKFHEDKRNMLDKKKWCFKERRPVIRSLSNAAEYDLYLKSQIKKTNYDWYL